MTINEKLNEFLYTYVQREAFKSCANWMPEKAVQRFANEVSEFDTLLYLIDKTSEGLINKENTVEKFRKAMEE